MESVSPERFPVAAFQRIRPLFPLLIDNILIVALSVVFSCSVGGVWYAVGLVARPTPRR
jgi:hypothetical protein